MKTTVYIFWAIFAVSRAEITGVKIDTTESEITACNNAQCNQACLSVHYDGGFCKDGDCWCWKTGASARRVEKSMTEIQSSTRGVSGCQDAQCDQACKSVHWDGGYCKNGNCWCWRRTLSGREEKPKSELQSNAVSCENDNCTLECKVRRFSGGLCKSGECMCLKERPQRGNWLPINDLATKYKDTSGNDLEACTDPVSCLDACQHHGAAGGFCLKQVCWCSMSYDRKTPSNRRVRPVIELQGNITGNTLDNDDSSCDSVVCSRLCRNNNKSAGVCLHGYCWCSNAKKQEPSWEKLSNIPQ